MPFVRAFVVPRNLRHDFLLPEQQMRRRGNQLGRRRHKQNVLRNRGKHVDAGNSHFPYKTENIALEYRVEKKVLLKKHVAGEVDSRGFAVGADLAVEGVLEHLRGQFVESVAGFGFRRRRVSEEVSEPRQKVLAPLFFIKRGNRLLPRDERQKRQRVVEFVPYPPRIEPEIQIRGHDRRLVREYRLAHAEQLAQVLAVSFICVVNERLHRVLVENVYVAPRGVNVVLRVGAFVNALHRESKGPAVFVSIHERNLSVGGYDLASRTYKIIMPARKIDRGGHVRFRRLFDKNQPQSLVFRMVPERNAPCSAAGIAVLVVEPHPEAEFVSPENFIPEGFPVLLGLEVTVEVHVRDDAGVAEPLYALEAGVDSLFPLFGGHLAVNAAAVKHLHRP